MESLVTDVNWLAVVVGAVAAFALGWFWYSEKAFGKKWMAGRGTPAVPNRPMGLPMFTQAVATFFYAWVIGVTETTDALPLAILIILTLSGIVKANGLFAGKNNYAIAVEAGYVVAMGLVFLLVQAIL